MPAAAVPGQCRGQQRNDHKRRPRCGQAPRQGGGVSRLQPDLHIVPRLDHRGQKGKHDRGRPGQRLLPRRYRLGTPAASAQGDIDSPRDFPGRIDPKNVCAPATIGKQATGREQRRPRVKFVQGDASLAKLLGNQERGVLLPLASKTRTRSVVRTAKCRW